MARSKLLKFYAALIVFNTTSPLCGEFGSLIKKTFSPSSPFECNLELIQITGAVGELSKKVFRKTKVECVPASKANQVHWVATSLILMMYDFVLNCACGGKQSAQFSTVLLPSRIPIQSFLK